METKINKYAKLLIISDLFYSLTSVFINTFLVAYFLNITNENITTIAIYYIIIYALLGFGNFLMTKFIKKYPSKSKLIMCFGIVVRAIFILSIVILADKIATNFVLIAIFYAFGEVLYWSSHELIYIDVTNNANRKNYMSINKILGRFIKIITPIILGTSIELYSFIKIAIYVFILTIIQIIITLFIKINIKDKNNRYSLKDLMNYIKENNIKKIRRYNLSAICYGIVESSISTLIVIITIMTFKTSFSLGVLTTIFNICSMIVLFLYKKFYNAKTSKYILILISVIIILGVIGLLISINKTTLVIYNFCYAISFCIFDVVYNTRKGDLIKECNISMYKEEYIGYNCLSLALGRVFGYLSMLVISFTNDIIYFKMLLAFVTLFAPLFCYFIFKSTKE